MDFVTSAGNRIANSDTSQPNGAMSTAAAYLKPLGITDERSIRSMAFMVLMQADDDIQRGMIGAPNRLDCQSVSTETESLRIQMAMAQLAKITQVLGSIQKETSADDDGLIANLK
jgi:hypothetical protein